MFDLGLESQETQFPTLEPGLAPDEDSRAVCEEKTDGEGAKDLRGEHGDPMKLSTPLSDADYQELRKSKETIDRVLREFMAIPSIYTNEKKEVEMSC